jgi:putative methionine-R-sulfoxide reductase with GAF domain
MPAGRLLTELSLLVAQEGDRHSRANAIAEAIRAAGAYRWTGIYDVDVRKGLVSNVAWSGSGAPQYPTFPVTQGLTSRVIASRKTVNVGDVASDPDYLTALATTRSEIIIPVLDAAGDCVLGTIDVESEQAHAFDLASQEHLEKCAKALRAFWTP